MPENVEVSVLFFGKARELAGTEKEKLTFAIKLRYEDLKHRIFRELFPSLEPIEESCILAVDQRYANHDEEVRLTASSEIAVIPPLSGG